MSERRGILSPGSSGVGVCLSLGSLEIKFMFRFLRVAWSIPTCVEVTRPARESSQRRPHVQISQCRGCELRKLCGTPVARGRFLIELAREFLIERSEDRLGTGLREPVRAQRKKQP